MSEAVIVSDGQGELLAMGPNRARVLTHREGCGFVVGEFPPGVPGPPLHRHDWDEAFYLLEGKLAVTIDSSTSIVWPGDFVLAPGGVAHTFAVHGDSPARFLAYFGPGRGLAYVKALAPAFGADGSPDLELVAAVHREYGVEVVGG